MMNASNKAKNDRKRGRFQRKNWISKTRRLSLYLRDGFQCQYCGSDLRRVAPADITLDHLVCQCEGGSDHDSNLVVACRSCNSARGNKPWREYATGGAVERIEKQRRRGMVGYTAMARAILRGETGDPRLEGRC
jgi:5-methylcytosine-specific restriction endonuclease McrA